MWNLLKRTIHRNGMCFHNGYTYQVSPNDCVSPTYLFSVSIHSKPHFLHVPIPCDVISETGSLFCTFCENVNLVVMTWTKKTEQGGLEPLSGFFFFAWALNYSLAFMLEGRSLKGMAALEYLCDDLMWFGSSKLVWLVLVTACPLAGVSRVTWRDLWD